MNRRRRQSAKISIAAARSARGIAPLRTSMLQRTLRYNATRISAHLRIAMPSRGICAHARRTPAHQRRCAMPLAAFSRLSYASCCLAAYTPAPLPHNVLFCACCWLLLRHRRFVARIGCAIALLRVPRHCWPLRTRRRSAACAVLRNISRVLWCAATTQQAAGDAKARARQSRAAGRQMAWQIRAAKIGEIGGGGRRRRRAASAYISDSVNDARQHRASGGSAAQR